LYHTIKHNLALAKGGVSSEVGKFIKLQVHEGPGRLVEIHHLRTWPHGLVKSKNKLFFILSKSEILNSRPCDLRNDFITLHRGRLVFKNIKLSVPCVKQEVVFQTSGNVAFFFSEKNENL